MDGEIKVDLVPGRGCNGCTLCCKLMRIDELDKPRGEWCPHCVVGLRCGIYATRPNSCRAWYCGYRLTTELSEAWYPKGCHMVIDERADQLETKVYVDPDFPGAWRGEPFHFDLRRLAPKMLAAGCWITIYVGARRFIVLPDRDVDMGHLPDDEETVVSCVTPHLGDKPIPVPYTRKLGTNSGPDPSLWRKYAR